VLFAVGLYVHFPKCNIYPCKYIHPFPKTDPATSYCPRPGRGTEEKEDSVPGSLEVQFFLGGCFLNAKPHGKHT